MFANEDRIAACRRGEDGSYLIDRSPKYFEPILNYLRTGQVLIKSHNTVVPGFRVLGFSALPVFRALKVGDGAWSVHKTLFGFWAPLSQLFI